MGDLAIWIAIAVITVIISFRWLYRPGVKLPAQISRELLSRLTHCDPVFACNVPFDRTFFASFSLRKKALVALNECLVLQRPSAMILLTAQEAKIAYEECRGVYYSQISAPEKQDQEEIVRVLMELEG